MSDEDTIKDLIIGGLLTDGAHHKQWYLEQILEKLGFSKDLVRLDVQVEDYDWDDGIPP